MPTIDTTAAEITSGGLLQNLGPDPVYIGDSSDVDSTSGFPVGANVTIALSNANGKLYAVSDGTSDVRQIPRATGMFYIQPPA